MSTGVTGMSRTENGQGVLQSPDSGSPVLTAESASGARRCDVPQLRGPTSPFLLIGAVRACRRRPAGSGESPEQGPVLGCTRVGCTARLAGSGG